MFLGEPEVIKTWPLFWQTTNFGLKSQNKALFGSFPQGHCKLDLALIFVCLGRYCRISLNNVRGH